MFKSAATKLAHNTTIPALALANQDLRPLQDLISAEKVVMITLQRLSTDFMKASEALKAWGLGEGDDLGDTLSASCMLLNQFAAGLTQLANHGPTMRDQLKGIRTHEEELDELKRRRRAVVGKADSADKKLAKMNPENKNLALQTDLLNKLRDEIRTLDAHIMRDEASLGDYKRTMTRTWVGLKFGGILECCEKGTIVGEYGKLIISEIPQDVTQPGLPRSTYYGQNQTQTLVAEASRCISEVKLSAIPNPSRLGLVSDATSYANAPQGSEASSPVWEKGMQNGSSPSNYLPPPQGLGGSFFDSPGQPMTFQGGSPEIPQAGPTFMTQPELQRSSDTSNLRTMDDFGVFPNGPNNAKAGGGRFATFPVKSRTPGVSISSSSTGYSLNDPPKLRASHEYDQSFASSIAEALGTPQEPTFGTSPPSAQSPPFPEPVVMPTPEVDEPEVGRSSNEYRSPLERRPDPLPVEDADNAAVLAYMTGADTDDRSEHASQGSIKRVRFGDVSDIEDDGPYDARQYNLSPPMLNPEHSSSKESLTSSRTNNSKRIPPPVFDPSAEERARNMAVAEEIGRELDALKQLPPSPLSSSFMEMNTPTPRAAGFRDEYPAGGSSPLSPRFNVDLRQSYDSQYAQPSYSPMTTQPSSPNSPPLTPAQAYARQNYPAPIDTRNSYYQETDAVVSRSPTSPYPQTSAAPPPVEVPQIQYQPSSPINSSYTPYSNGNSSPYQTPPESLTPGSPSSNPAAPPPTYNKPPTSPPVLPGQKTISAAAFKRPVGRAGAPLPSSPYPNRRGEAAGQGGRFGPSGSSPLVPTIALGGSPLSSSGSPMSQPSREPSGANSMSGSSAGLGSVPPFDPRPFSTATMNTEFDVIGSYMDSPPPSGALRNSFAGPQGGQGYGQPQQRDRSPIRGYGQGRFATNLDGAEDMR